MVGDDRVISPYNQAVEIQFSNAEDYYNLANKIYNGEWGYYGNAMTDHLEPGDSLASKGSFGIVHFAFNHQDYSINLILGNGISPYNAPERERVWEMAMEEIDNAHATAQRAYIRERFSFMLAGAEVNIANAHIDFLESTYNAQVAATESVYSRKQ